MPKQKRGFLLFICSLIPGAGEMYLGFFKQGISIMTLFWAIVAIAGGFSAEFLVIFLPVIWFYSYFHVHNLKELPEEEFYASKTAISSIWIRSSPASIILLQDS